MITRNSVVLPVPQDVRIALSVPAHATNWRNRFTALIPGPFPCKTRCAKRESRQGPRRLNSGRSRTRTWDLFLIREAL
jgi:hypothetical protein